MAKRARHPASRVSNALQRTERQRLLLDGIRLAQSQFIAGNNKAQFFRALLDTIVAATGSAYGFIGEIVQPPAGAPYLQSVVTSRFPRTRKTRQLWEEREKRGSQFRNLDTLFGHVIATGKPVIANDAGHDPRAGGVPPGHPPLKAFVGLPFHHGDALVGMVGLANRKGGRDCKRMDVRYPVIVETVYQFPVCHGGVDA